MEVNVHDLVYLESSQAIYSDQAIPEWLQTEETAKNIAVVRRMKTMNHVVPIGFRGKNRSERFAAFTKKDSIRKIITPVEARHGNVPASHRQTIDDIRCMFKEVHWGIGGSVGFTMATGIQACRHDSDVDIIMYVERKASLQTLQHLYEKIQHLAHRIDVQVEICQIGSCLLNEVVTSPSALVRTGTGVFLMRRESLFGID